MRTRGRNNNRTTAKPKKLHVGTHAYKKASGAMHRSKCELKALEKRLGKTCREADRHSIKKKITAKRQELRDNVRTVYTAVGSKWERSGNGYRRKRRGC